MPITEFVHLHLPSPYHSSHPTLLSSITKCTAIMHSSSQLPSIFLADLTDPNRIYVLGGWPSQEAHQHGFSGSQEQTKLIRGIEGLMEIVWMEYLGVEMGVEGRLRGKGLGGGGDGEAKDGGEVEIDLRGKGCFGAVVVDMGDLDESGGGKGKKDSLERTITETITNAGLQTGGVIKTWNLKKHEKETEKDYLVLLKVFDDADVAETWGREVVSGIEKIEGVESVLVKYFRKAEYEE